MNNIFKIVCFNFVYALILVAISLLLMVYGILSLKVNNPFVQTLIILFNFALYLCIFIIKGYLFFIIKNYKFFKNFFTIFDENRKYKAIGIGSALIFDLIATLFFMQDLEKIKMFSCLFYMILSFGGVSFSYLSYLILKKQKLKLKD